MALTTESLLAAALAAAEKMRREFPPETMLKEFRAEPETLARFERTLRDQFGVDIEPFGDFPLGPYSGAPLAEDAEVEPGIVRMINRLGGCMGEVDMRVKREV